MGGGSRPCSMALRLQSWKRLERWMEPREGTIRGRAAGDGHPGQRAGSTRALRSAGLFAGVGGLDRGLAAAGCEVSVLCEAWEPARAVLRAQFPSTPLQSDIRDVESLPPVDIIAAGFPCNDLSPIGNTAGIEGPKSGLLSEVFRLAQVASPSWILLENVPNMLVLHKGAAMRMITTALETLGYVWAYRVVDARFTGIPQRRLRVLLMATNGSTSPEDLLLSDDAGEPVSDTFATNAFGFYWTEGRGGLGWARDAIPTLKGGSTIGLSSAPGVWLRDRPRGERLVIPSVEDGERFQGLPAGWTSAAAETHGRDHRWKLIGNAVSFGVALWLGERLTSEGRFQPVRRLPLMRDGSWPSAGWGGAGGAWTAKVSAWPRVDPYMHLADFLEVRTAMPLSHRAARGFLQRLDESKLAIDPDFFHDVEDHVRMTRPSRSAQVSGRRPRGPVRASWASSPESRRRMQANRDRDTKPELLLRRELHRLGLRYRLHSRPQEDIRSRVDIVFRPSRVAIDVRGCFWHACPQHRTEPKANGDHWKNKLQRNVERDQATELALATSGWAVVVVWEHEDMRAAAERILILVTARRPTHNRRVGVRSGKT